MTGSADPGETGRPDAVDRLMARAVTAGVIEPRERPQDFAKALHHLLQTRGMAVYFASIGASPRDLLRAVRETPADTSVVFIQYAPEHFGLWALLLATLRWRLDGRWVVICRTRAPFQRRRQRLAYALLRLVIGLELAGTDDAAAALRTWPRGHVPPRSRLAEGWIVRSERASVDEILPLLRCPRCRRTLGRDRASLSCANGHEFPIVDGIPVLLPEHLDIDLDRHRDAHPAGDAYNAAEHPGWHEIGFAKRDLVARMLRSHPQPRASIDIGCGDWGLHHAIAGAIGTELSVAGDISLELVRHARHASPAPGRIHYVVFAAEALPFRDSVFDLTYCSEVLEHLARPELAVAEMRRTSAAGRVIVTVPNERLTGKLEEGHLQTFGYDDLVALLRPHVEVRRAKGVFWFREQDIDGLHRSAWGRVRMAAYLMAGEWRPRESVNVVVEGRSRPLPGGSAAPAR